MKQMVVLSFLFCLQVTAGQSQTPDGNGGATDLEGTWVTTASGCEGSSISPSNARLASITLRGTPGGYFTMLQSQTPSGFDGGVVAYQGSYSTKVQGPSSTLEGVSTIATFGQGVADETRRGNAYRLPKASPFQVKLAGGQLTLYSSTASCRYVMSFRKASAQEIATIDKQVLASNSNLASLLSSSDGNPGAGYNASVASANAQRSDQRAALSAGRCNWSNDFSFIRDPDMLNTLKTENFSQKLAQGGQPIDQQISAGEAALQQITDSLPNIETGIRAISSPQINHFNFTFDYVATCKQNREANQGTALLAEMCQHVNVENTRYALNGTLQIMDCMAGRLIRADIGPNQDTPVLATELPPDVRSAVVPVSTGDCSVQNSGDTYGPPPNPNCPHVSRPGDPKPGDKITH